jgi:hypothetical protein
MHARHTHAHGMHTPRCAAEPGRPIRWGAGKSTSTPPSPEAAHSPAFTPAHPSAQASTRAPTHTLTMSPDAEYSLAAGVDATLCRNCSSANTVPSTSITSSCRPRPPGEPPAADAGDAEVGDRGPVGSPLCRLAPASAALAVCSSERMMVNTTRCTSSVYRWWAAEGAALPGPALGATAPAAPGLPASAAAPTDSAAMRRNRVQAPARRPALAGRGAGTEAVTAPALLVAVPAPGAAPPAALLFRDSLYRRTSSSSTSSISTM